MHCISHVLLLTVLYIYETALHSIQILSCFNPLKSWISLQHILISCVDALQRKYRLAWTTVQYIIKCNTLDQMQFSLLQFAFENFRPSRTVAAMNLRVTYFWTSSPHDDHDKYLLSFPGGVRWTIPSSLLDIPTSP